MLMAACALKVKFCPLNIATHNYNLFKFLNFAWKLGQIAEK